MTERVARVATFAADPPAADALHAYDPESFVLISAIADSLAYVDLDGHIRPSLALGWERVNPVTFDFTLRSGVEFECGEVLDARSVVATFRQHIHGPTPLGQSIFSPIAGVDRLADDRVRFTLHFPDSLFVNRLALFGPVYPHKLLESEGAEGVLRDPNGAGAFRLEGWDRGKEIRLTRRARHWGGRGKVDRLIFPIAPQNLWLDMLERGDADLALNLDPHDAYRARSLPGLNVSARVGVMPQFFLLKNEGPLADARVRQALNFALQRAVLVTVASHGLGVHQTGIAKAGQPGYRADRADYFYDLERAKTLLRDAGVADGFPLRGLVCESSASLFALVREFFLRIGVKLQAEVVSRPEFLMRGPVDRMRGGPGYDGDFMLISYDDPISHPFFQHFSQLSDKSPFSMLRHDEYNQRFIEAVVSLSEEELGAKASLLEDFVSKESLFVFTTSEAVYAVSRHGYEIPLPASGHFNFNPLWELTGQPQAEAAAPAPSAAPDLGPIGEHLERLISDTSHPGNLRRQGSTGVDVIERLWRNIELHEARWRGQVDTMIGLIVDQAAAQAKLDNISRATQQVGIVVERDDSNEFTNVAYSEVTGCPAERPLSEVLFDSSGERSWDSIREIAQGTGRWSGVVNMGPSKGATRKMFATVTPAYAELGAQSGYACTFVDYSGEEERLRRKAEAETAAIVQQALIPTTERLDHLASHYRPAGETGGDWFFIHEDERQILLLVADVTGHGMAPALVTASITGAMEVIDRDLSPSGILDLLDRVVSRTGFGEYRMTCVCLRVDKATRTYRLANAAHPAPAVLSGGKVSRLVAGPSALVGEGSRAWSCREGEVAPGDVVLLYTDGVIDNVNDQGTPFGQGRFVRLVNSLASETSCGRVIRSIVDATEQFSGGTPLEDDVTLVAVRLP